MAASSRKRKSEELTVGQCILCYQECHEDKSNTSVEAWTNFKQHAEEWLGLDMYGTVYHEVKWENGPHGIYFHKLCKTQLFSKNKLQQALNRKHKQQLEKKKTADQQPRTI
ncbi:hypothetical protein Pmani_023877 [Petrolisthes manimaculis]|uniref:Uncharacterized protein n=1 Tax=Petrolisthes manimaculis TaxID=1843537 RepID=A0AAE1TZV0_9EUCA|nr:hypothetical protein Pmani_023877 [Petrolisthes manimaculis]